MGITIYSKNLSHYLGSGGFYRLSKTIASLCPEDIKDHYMLLADHYYDLQLQDPGFKNYDLKTEELYQKYLRKYGKIIDFLWAPDIECKLTYGTAGQLLNLIGNYDDDHIYGYAGWGDKAMRFQDFKNILTDAYTTKTKWGWR